MTRACRVAIFVAFLACSLLAGDQRFPPELEVGSKFVWHVAHCDTVQQVATFDPMKAKILMDDDFKRELNGNKQAGKEGLLAELKRVRAKLEPNVRVVKAGPLLDGEQYAIFALTPRDSRQKYVRLHIVSRIKPFVIDEIQQLSQDEVFTDLSGGRLLNIPQETPKIR